MRHRCLALLMPLLITACTQTSEPSSRGDSSDAAVGSHTAPVEQRAELTLVPKDGGAVSLRYVRGKQGPRVVELMLQSSDELKLTQHEAGPATLGAGKDLHVQDKGNGQIRLLILSSSNVNELESGELATLRFTKSDASRKGRLEILTGRPMFAPQEAQEGLSVGDPIEL